MKPEILTDDMIRKLAADAGAAGDLPMLGTCHRALGCGFSPRIRKRARAACAAAITDALRDLDDSP